MQTGHKQALTSVDVGDISDWTEFLKYRDALSGINIMNAFVFFLAIPVSFEYAGHFIEELKLIKISLADVFILM